MMQDLFKPLIVRLVGYTTVLYRLRLISAQPVTLVCGLFNKMLCFVIPDRPERIVPNPQCLSDVLC